MDVMADVHGIEEHLRSFLESARQVAEVHLPQVQALAEQASGNPAVMALLGAVHLGGAPELLAELAQTIGRIDAALGDAKAAAQQPPAPQA